MPGDTFGIVLVKVTLPLVSAVFVSRTVLATISRTDSFCHRMLQGAPSTTADAGLEPAYYDTPVGLEIGVTS